MTYSAGSTILATDYNGFVSTNGANVNDVWNTNYGQTALTTVSAAAGTVSAQQWTDLNNTITYAATHQGTSITSRTNPSPGNTIAILNNLSTDVTAINTNKYNAAASGTQFTGYTGTSYQATVVGHRATSWTITFTHTVNFPNATAATSFWSAGGLVKVQFGKSSTGFPADASWNTLASTTCGAVWISADAASKTINGTAYTGTKVIGGAGTPTVATAVGWNQLTGVAQQLFQQFSTTYVYTGTYIQVQAAKSATALTLTTNWFSPARNVAGTSNEISGGTAPSGISFGTAPTTIVTYFPPSTTGPISNTWGSPTVVASVSAPTY